MNELFGFIGDNALICALVIAGLVMWYRDKKSVAPVQPLAVVRRQKRTIAKAQSGDVDIDVVVASVRKDPWEKIAHLIDRQQLKASFLSLGPPSSLKRTGDYWKLMRGIQHRDRTMLAGICHQVVDCESKDDADEVRRLYTACAYIFDHELPPELILIDKGTYDLIAWYTVFTYPMHLHEYLALDKDNTDTFPSHQDIAAYDILLADIEYVISIVAHYPDRRLPNFMYVYTHAEASMVGDEQTKQHNLRLQLTYHACVLGMPIPADWYAMNPYLYRKLLNMQLIYKG